MRILAITGSRADWGYLVTLLKLLRGSPDFDLRLVVTGQHFEDVSGKTVEAIKQAGFGIAAAIDPQLGGDAARDTTQAMARITAGMADILADLQPDMMLLLGDRYETLACANAAMMARVPIAHLCGGDVSEGAVDDAIRHALSKLSHLHFPTNTDAAQRLLLMGEAPDRVHMVGSTGLDLLLAVPRLTRSDFFKRIGFEARPQNLLITMHPVTLADNPIADARALFAALERFGEAVGFLITGTNADTGRHGITQLIHDFVASRSCAKFIASLGSDLYVNAMAQCDVMVGNSSSGLYEAPSLSLHAVNIGIRQKGRLRATSVIDCAGEADAIETSIRRALKTERRAIVNPYGDGQASKRVVEVLRSIEDPSKLLVKQFHQVKHD